MPLSEVIAVAAVGWAAVSTLVAWAFATGKFAGRTVTRQELEAALEDKADCDRVTRLDRRLTSEHDERKRQFEGLNVMLGNLRVDQATQQQRVIAVDERVKDLYRKVFNGGGVAGV